MTIVTGKHKEILIEMLLYYVTSHDFLIENKYMVDDIKVQNETGKEWIEYYINTAY
jgi:hypothetical protein